MARPFRFILKKRGDRRTGSRQFGRWGQALVFALAFSLGAMSLGMTVVNHTIPEWRINHDYLPVRCTVRDKRVREIVADRGGFQPEFLLRFELADGVREAWGYDGGGWIAADRAECESLLGQFEVGGEYSCWYDPVDPAQAVLVRGYTFAAWMRLLLPLPFLAIGGGGLTITILNWGKSAERRVAQAHGGPFDSRPNENGQASAFPTVPDGRALTNSPGTRLKYRLPTSRPGWRLWSLSAAFVVWNGVLLAFIIMALGANVEGASRWLLGAFLLPCLAVGGWMAVALLKKIVQSLRVGPTIVEISDHPWHPGGRFTVFASQAGKLRFDAWRFFLVCEEEATFSQGTNKRTETRRVFECELWRRDRATADSRSTLEAECEIVVPPAAMHSFESGHNRIRWQLLLKGDRHGQPSFERAFTVHVQPASQGKI